MKLLLLIFQCYFKKFEVYDYWESGCLNGIYNYATNYIICVTNAYINYPLPARGPINQHHIGMSCLGTAAGDLKLVRSLCTWRVNVTVQPVNKWNVMKIGWKCTWRAFCKFVITWNGNQVRPAEETQRTVEPEFELRTTNTAERGRAEHLMVFSSVGFQPRKQTSFA